MVVRAARRRRDPGDPRRGRRVRGELGEDGDGPSALPGDLRSRRFAARAHEQSAGVSGDGVVRPVAWVLGRGGLLGRQHGTGARVAPPTCGATARRSRGRTRAVSEQIATAVAAFAARVGRSPWRVAWCAGASVVSADQATLDRETMVLARLAPRARRRHRRSSTRARCVLLRLVSRRDLRGIERSRRSTSALDARVPISPYGHAKLLQEGMVRSWAAEHGVPSLIGRISNLYGPGQNLSKPQGLVSQLCWSQLLQRPVNIYVPLETRRRLPLRTGLRRDDRERPRRVERRSGTAVGRRAQGDGVAAPDEHRGGARRVPTSHEAAAPGVAAYALRSLATRCSTCGCRRTRCVISTGTPRRRFRSVSTRPTETFNTGSPLAGGWPDAGGHARDDRGPGGSLMRRPTSTPRRVDGLYEDSSVPRSRVRRAAAGRRRGQAAVPVHRRSWHCPPGTRWSTSAAARRTTSTGCPSR